VKAARSPDSRGDHRHHRDADELPVKKGSRSMRIPQSDRCQRASFHEANPAEDNNAERRKRKYQKGNENPPSRWDFLCYQPSLCVAERTLS